MSSSSTARAVDEEDIIVRVNPRIVKYVLISQPLFAYIFSFKYAKVAYFYCIFLFDEQKGCDKTLRILHSSPSARSFTSNSEKTRSRSPSTTRSCGPPPSRREA